MKPWATWTIVALNGAAFVAAAAQGADVMHPDSRLMIGLGSNFGPLTISGEWWRLASSTLLHFGILHLLLNMWALWSAGPLVERLYGHARFTLLYVFAGLAGSLASVLWNPTVNSAGASGAIFGVYGALTALLLRKHSRLPAAAVPSLRASALAFIAFNLVNGMLNSGIDNAAHLGGLAGGFLLGLPLAGSVAAESAPHRAAWRLAAAVLLGAGVLALASLPLSLPGSPRQAESRYRADAFWFSTHETAVLQDFNDMIGRAARREVTQQAIADLLAREANPFWVEADRRLSRHGALRDPALDAERRLVQEYVKTRREAFALMLRGLQSGSERDLRRGREANDRAEALIRNRTASRAPALRSHVAGLLLQGLD